METKSNIQIYITTTKNTYNQGLFGNILVLFTNILHRMGYIYVLGLIIQPFEY